MKKLTLTRHIQSLAGTVVTGENKEGEKIKSGVVTVYQVGTSSSGHIIDVPIKLQGDNFEAFIPDTYLLAGNDYFLLLKSEEEKMIYTKRLIGQQEKIIELKAEQLKKPGY